MQSKTHLIFHRTALCAAILMASAMASVSAAPPSTSAYATDPVETHVQDQAASAFNEANTILCYIGQLKAENFINAGTYVVLNDTSKCEQSGTSDAASAGSGGASTNNAPSYERITVNATQASNTEPVIVKAWVDESGSSTTMPVKMTVTQTPTAANPLGKFRMDWGAVSATNQGILQSAIDSQGRNVLQLLSAPSAGDNSTSNRVSLIKNGTSSGVGSAEISGTQVSGTQSANIAFDSSHFLRRLGNTETCLDRDNPDASVWSYGLYDATSGARVNAESGWPITKNGYYGWAGYWGVWLPPEAAVSSGDTVQKTHCH